MNTPFTTCIMIKDLSISFSRVIDLPISFSRSNYQDYKTVNFNVLFEYKPTFSVVFFNPIWNGGGGISSSEFLPNISKTA